MGILIGASIGILIITACLSGLESDLNPHSQKNKERKAWADANKYKAAHPMQDAHIVAWRTAKIEERFERDPSGTAIALLAGWALILTPVIAIAIAIA